MGISSSTSAIRFCRSSPLSPGSCKSKIKQPGASARERARNSCAEANVSTLHPADSDQTLETLPHRGVVVHNRDNWCQTPATAAFDSSSWYFGRVKWKMVLQHLSVDSTLE